MYLNTTYSDNGDYYCTTSEGDRLHTSKAELVYDDSWLHGYDKLYLFKDKGLYVHLYSDDHLGIYPKMSIVSRDQAREMTLKQGLSLPCHLATV